MSKEKTMDHLSPSQHQRPNPYDHVVEDSHKPRRKIISYLPYVFGNTGEDGDITTTVIAVCNDMTVWTFNDKHPRWIRFELPPIPQDEVKT